MELGRRNFLKISALSAMGGSMVGLASCSQREGEPERGSFSTEEVHFPTQVQIEGDLGHRIALTERRLQSHPYDVDFVVQDVARVDGLLRRFEEYEGDVSGRILGAWSYISRLTGSHPDKLDLIAERVLQHQSTEGWFGINQRGGNFDMWGRQNFGHGRLLVGLVEYYRLSSNEEVLNAAEKLAGYFVDTIPLWTTEYEEHPWKKMGKVDWGDNTSNRLHFIKTHQTSVLEGLMMLHTISPKPAYLEAGQQIVDLFPAFGQFHSHSYLNTLVGVALLYQHTGDTRCLELLESEYWQYIMLRGVPADGGICEWFPRDHRTEGCSITDWVRLNLKMWEITRNAVYMEQAERTWLNALNFHQTGNGAFGHTGVTPSGYTGDYAEAWWCCLMHGLFAQAELVEHAAAEQGNDIWFNFYTPLSFELNGRTVGIETTYPASGDINITPGMSGARTIHLRIPAWVERFDVSVNDQSVAGEMENGYFVFSREWRPEDTLTLQFPVGLRIEDEHGNDLLDMRELGDHFHTAYLFHGPLMLGTNKNDNDRLPDSLTFNAGSDYSRPFSPGTFAVSGSHYQIPGLSGVSSSTAILRPISEHTGYTEWTDELPNFRRNGEQPIQRPAVQTRQQIKIVRD